jgi:hypothetical protein
MGNDFANGEVELGLCNHQQPWETCTSEVCQEIWGLCRKSLREDRQVKAGRAYAANARKSRRKTKSQYDIALDKPQLGKREDHELKIAEELTEHDTELDQLKLLQKIFPDEITMRAAVQFKVLTLRQVRLLEAYFESDETLPLYKRWDSIGEKIGCSGKTVGREFKALVGKFLKAAASRERLAVIEVVHVRGERRPRYYRKQSIQIGEWRREWSELITDKKVIRELRRTSAPMIRLKKTPVPSSPVNRLFGALIRHFASDLPAGDVRPYDITVRDWEYNLRKAERILKRKSAGPWTALEVYRTLGRGAGLCRGCRTFLIRGFRINGRRNTKAKEFCDSACKMRTERTKTRSANPPNSRLASASIS